MSPLDGMRPTLARARRRLAAAGRRMGSPDPRVWLIHGRHADIVVAAVFFAAGAAFLAFLAASDATTIVVGLPPIAFILFVLVRAYRASVARRDEEADEIDDARSVASQCVASLDLIGESLSELPEDYRTHLALSWLSSQVRLLVTRYRRYLSQDAVWAVLEAENLILKAILSRSGELGVHVDAIGGQLEIMVGGIIDIDAPRLRAARGRI